MSTAELFKEWLAIDAAWSGELHRAFGKRAGDVRYTKEGEGLPGTKLNDAYLAFVVAGKAWRDSV